jgi:hypothetical protein
VKNFFACFEQLAAAVPASRRFGQAQLAIAFTSKFGNDVASSHYWAKAVSAKSVFNNL